MGKLAIRSSAVWQKNSLWAKFPGLKSGHGRMNPEFARFIRRRSHDAPSLASADNHRLAAQTRVEHLLHRGEEGIHIDVKVAAHGRRLARRGHRIVRRGRTQLE